MDPTPGDSAGLLTTLTVVQLLLDDYDVLLAVGALHHNELLVGQPPPVSARRDSKVQIRPVSNRSSSAQCEIAWPTTARARTAGIGGIGQSVRIPATIKLIFDTSHVWGIDPLTQQARALRVHQGTAPYGH